MANSRQLEADLPTDLRALPDGWSYKLLGSLVDVNRGISYGIVQPGSPEPQGVPTVRVNNLKQGCITTDEVLRVSADIESRHERTRLRGGEVLLTLVGTLGECAVVPEILAGWNVARAVGVIPVIEEVGAKWVYLCLRTQTIQRYIRTWATTTVQATFNLRDVAKLPIPLPPKQEREAIAHILGTLDDKIELNQQMNRNLEALAQAIFKSWFVDFDPVRAKMEGRQPAGMDAATAALFPDSFEESPLGKIPMGWKVGTLNEITEFVLGGDWGNDTFTGEYSQTAYCIRGADIPDLQSAGLGKMPIRYLKPSSVKKRSLLPGDIVIEISGGSPTQSTGRPVLITTELLGRLAYPLVCSNFCRMFRLTRDMPPTFIYLWLRWLYTSDAFLQYENGTTGIKNFAYTIFSQQQGLIIPPKDLLDAVEIAVSQFFKKRQANGLQSATIAAFRDALLPKLMSGEIRVKDAEMLVETAA